MERRYRLEVSVRRIYNMSTVSAHSRLTFVVRFLNFPKIVISPHTSHGGGVSERTATGDGILSLTYNSTHCAVFLMSDSELNSVQPLSAHCQILDEHNGQQQQLMSWSVPVFLSLPTDGNQNRALHSMHSMLNAQGQIVGFADMFARVVLLGSDSPQVQTPTSVALASHHADGRQQSQQQQSSGPWVPLVTRDSTIITASNGKQYAVKVVVDDKVAQSQQGKSSDNHAATRDKQQKRRGPQVAKKKSLLYFLQYDVAYQLLSNAETLSATLRRENEKLNSVALEMNSGLIRQSEITIQKIGRLTNIAMQIANGLIGHPPAIPEPVAAVATSTKPAVENDKKGEATKPTLTAAALAESKGQALGHSNPRNYNLKVPKEGSVACFLQYEVLFQLQCLTTNMSYLTEQYRDVLEVPLGSLHKQHRKFFNGLCAEIVTLNRLTNIIVQSTVDGLFGRKDAFPAGDQEEEYSSDSSDSSSSSSSSSSNAVHPPQQASKQPSPATTTAQSTAPRPAGPVPAVIPATTAPPAVPAPLSMASLAPLPLPVPIPVQGQAVPGSSGPLPAVIPVPSHLSTTAAPLPQVVPLPLTAAASPVPATAAAIPAAVPLPSVVPTPAPLPGAIPAPVPAALPAPVPVPAAILMPVPLPSAAPTPVPAAIPAPIPLPSAVPAPVPVPAAIPTPLPSAMHAAIPVPVPMPAALPAPVPVPAAIPAPIPVPAPVPVPAAIPTPLPLPAAAPAPVAGPSALPTPMPVPAAVPLPSAIPKPLPVAAPVPAHSHTAAVASIPHALPLAGSSVVPSASHTYPTYAAIPTSTAVPR